MAETSFDANRFVQDFLNADRLYTTTFTTLNNSGVTGSALVAVDGSDLTVLISAQGLEPGQPHPQHIHGFPDFSQDAHTPTTARDTDGDGYVELGEGLPDYGPVLLSLTSPPGSDLSGFPTAPGGGLFFVEHYHLCDGIACSDDEGTTHSGHSGGDLGITPEKLDFREIVLHGMSVPAGAGAGTGGEVDGAGGYKAVLPVASGELSEVEFAGNNVHRGTNRSEVLNGGRGNDKVYGKGGNDVLNGHNGNDRLFGDSGNDRLFGGNGNDRLEGGDGRDRLSGDNGNDTVIGGAGNDRLLGGNGNDWLSGGSGKDILTGGNGRDHFVFNEALGPTNVDQITDFDVRRDTISLENTVFTALSEGPLAAAAFHVTNSATLVSSAEDRVIYQRNTGNLYYDSDGTGSEAAILFAHLDARLTLTSSNFEIV